MFKLLCPAPLLLAVLFLAAPAAADELKVGDDAPDFKLEASDGKTYELKDFKDEKAIVIAWFPKAFTGGCTKACKSMRENGEAVRKFDVAYFAASVDDVDTNKKFAESLDLDFPILSDPSKEAAAAYGALNPKNEFSFRYTYYIGKDGKILHIDKEVKADSHGKDIAAKLKELGVEEK